ncbi:hypothetical protein [Breoghania sp. JC706]|uniref:hypothetical protein n=1 Tax=Breoghania sp. JC706 TaxID=3117732 RepID=UPI0030095827
MKRVVLSILLFVIGFSPAWAEHFDYRVKAGKANEVYVFGRYRVLTCQADILPQLTVRQKPKHGSVKFVKSMVRLSADTGKCAGQQIKGMKIIYTPARGYRGKDAFSVSYPYFVYESGMQRSTETMSFSLDVR